MLRSHKRSFPTTQQMGLHKNDVTAHTAQITKCQSLVECTSHNNDCLDVAISHNLWWRMQEELFQLYGEKNRILYKNNF